NKEELAESMINLLNDTEFADKIGKEGYKTVKEKFSWEAIAKRTLEFYESYLQ
ncbi:unnamed protein product, partial [marine sediment metagenome]